jgi:hemoglobin-like flavoprotein
MSQTALAFASPPSRHDSGPLTEEEKFLVRQSFRRIEPAIELVVQLFYRRLFDIAPEVRPLFSDDMYEQQRKLISALRLCIAALDKVEEIVPTLKLLGTKHRSYGVEAQHYGAVGEALLWTLGECLKGAFTPQTRDAWTAVYTLLAETMHDVE